MANVEKIIAEQSVLVEIDAIKPYRKNPRVGNVEAIAESLKENGMFRPVVVQKSTGEILAGNHTWKAAKHLGWKNIQCTYVDVDDERAKRIVLADNRTNDFASYDTDVLTEILAGLPTPVGTGYDDQAVRTLLAGIQDRDADLIQTVTRPPQKVEFEGGSEAEWDLSSSIKAGEERRDLRGTEGIIPQLGGLEATEKMRVAESIMAIQMNLDTWLEKKFSSGNYWGIPDLRRDMLVEDLPDPLATWGGSDATPDDGKTTYLWNAGLASTKDIPWDRVITSFFTYDTNFDNWLLEPAFNVAKMIHNGCLRSIVPDTSFWIEDTRFHHLGAQYNAQWLARFMQEAGVRVIPRFMWCDLEAIKVGLLGVPKKPPIAAVALQTITDKEADAAMVPEGLRIYVKEIQPEALIIYGGNPARRIAEKAVLPKELHVVYVDNYAAVRRGTVYDNPTGKKLVDKENRKKGTKPGTKPTGLDPDTSPEQVEEVLAGG